MTPAHRESVVARPAAALAGLVRSYVGYRLEGFPPGTHLGLPSPDLTVVIAFGPPTRLAQLPDPGQPPASYDALASGLATRPAVIAHDGTQHGIQVALTPAGARAVLGVPAGALGPAVVDLCDVVGTEGVSVVDRLASPLTWQARFRLVDDWFVRRAARARALLPAALAHAWELTMGSGGSIPVSELASTVGWSRRHLGARFTAEFGLAPKDAGRVVRFARSQRLIARGAPLAAVAAACGFYDQAHLAREWRALAGCPPSAWLAAGDLPIVQDDGLEEEA